jgi:hypothetical protein
LEQIANPKLKEERKLPVNVVEQQSKVRREKKKKNRNWSKVLFNEEEFRKGKKVCGGGLNEGENG